MADASWEIKNLEDASKALGQYINDVDKASSDMNRAATSCVTNLGSDKFSQQAIDEVIACQKKLAQSVETAKGLKKKIDDKIAEIKSMKL